MKNTLLSSLLSCGLAVGLAAGCQAAPAGPTTINLPPGAGTAAAIGREFHPPVMAPPPTVFTPRPQKWVEPQPLNLPSAEKLDTIVIRDKTFDIKRISKEAQDYAYRRWQVRNGKVEDKNFDATKPFARYEKTDEALTFDGGGRGGRESKERLIVENCTFIIDFQEGDFGHFNPRRAAIYVNGYKEVLVRNCVFISKARGRDPLRKVIGSVVVYDTVNVQVENCYFEGRTVGWRGHVLVYACGPTSIRNIEINGRNDTAGGIWVATGVGESKIGAPHSDNPELMIYPPGPLLIENAWVHDQKGKENSDGIYVQSIQPYLMRNCKVERWGEDSLIDTGFRDVAKKPKDQPQLINHGGLGMIENCEFGDGWLKDSVGMGGGQIFRNNLLRPNTYFFPYVFDGGSWYVVNNKFEDMNSVIVSGRNYQLDGWTPGEGMFINGSKMYLFNNYFQAPEGKPVKALYVGGAIHAPLRNAIVADYNIYDMPAPKVWGIEARGVGTQTLPDTKPPADARKGVRAIDAPYPTIEEWRKETGNDKHSVLGTELSAESLQQFAKLAPDTFKLPGGVPMQWGELGKIGLLGPVGVTADVTNRAKTISAEIAQDYAEKNFTLQPEKLDIKDKTLEVKQEDRSYASGGAYLLLTPKAAGEKVSFIVKTNRDYRYYVSTSTLGLGGAGKFQLQVNGKPVGEPFSLGKRGAVSQGKVALTPGEHLFTFISVDGAPGSIDAMTFQDADVLDAESARVAIEKAKADQARAQRDRIDALKTKFEMPNLPIAGKIKGHTSKAAARGREYLLWQATGVGDSIPFAIDVPKAGEYEISIVTTNQADQGELTVLIDDKEVGTAKLAGYLLFGTQQLSAGNHTVTFKLTAPKDAKATSVRFQRLDLLPTAELAKIKAETAANGEDDNAGPDENQ